jgi:hypothetical protein
MANQKRDAAREQAKDKAREAIATGNTRYL